MANMFEKTMNACLESRRVEKKNLKTLKEAEELIDKELGLFDDEDEIINADDTAVDPDLDPDVKMGDFADDVVVVLDPEVAPDTKPEDMPPVEDYIGDFTYRCPICGNTFFSEEEMHDGDECPVCADTPSDGFELVGEVAESDATDEDKKDDEKKDDKKDDKEKDEEVDVEDLEVSDEEFEESMKRRATRRPMPRRTAENRVPSRRPAPRRTAESRVPARRPVARRPVAAERRAPVSRRPMKMEDVSFSRYLTKFIRENYKNARSLRVVGATCKNNTLVLECRLAMNSGKTRTIKLTCEGYRPAGKFILRAKDDGILKRESKQAPITFNCAVRNNTVVCEGMRYNFISKVAEGKRAHVSGRYLSESARRTPAPRRTMESRRPVSAARRPAPRRVTESAVRRPVRRTMPGRTVESRRPVRRMPRTK